MPPLIFLMTERGSTNICCRILAHPPSPHATIYLTILLVMTKRGEGRHIIFCRILSPPMPPSPDATILNNLNDREGVPLSL